MNTGGQLNMLGGGPTRVPQRHSTGGMPQGIPIQRKPAPPPGGKLMRLRCRFRPLHDAYIKDGNILEEDADVIFVCGDGHQLRAHKVIMASSSKFFAKLFDDQANITAVVSVPDIKVDVMKLILQLTYRDRVILTMKQIKDVGEFLTIFGMAWTQFGYEEYAGEEPMSSPPMPPVPATPIELPSKVIFVNAKNLTQRQFASPTRVVTGQLQQQKQNLQNGNLAEDYGQQQQGASSSSHGVAQNERHSRKTKLTPRAGAEVEEDKIMEQEEDEDPENKMRDWMAKLGKRDPSTSSAPNVPAAKRMRPAADQHQQQGEPGQGGELQEKPKPNYKCSTCHGNFKSEFAWKWHEERHVAADLYRCQFCDELVETPKQCYIHEKEVHGYSGLKLEANANANSNSNNSQQTSTVARVRQGLIRINQPNRMTSNISGGYTAFSKKIKMATLKKVQAQQMKRPINFNFATKHPNIAVGISEGSELVDLKKIKQLHWLYVCQRCDHCSDSASKAETHYQRCYPDQDEDFEKTVVKHRQGFYGKSKCPLCPRRYPLNSGFMIHCGHQHQQYRRLFTHTGTHDDQLSCQNCKQVFAEPTAFNEHLVIDSDGLPYCAESIKDLDQEEVKVVKQPTPVKQQPPAQTQQAPAKRPGPGRPSNASKARPKRVESPIEAKASYKVQFHTPPKSARLASRVKAEASAEAAKQKQTVIDFPAVDCPVCGEGEVFNISQHLQEKHKELKIDVTRISSELFRCKNCTITFSVCDLLDHKNCFENKETASAADAEVAVVDSEVTSPSTSAKAKQQPSGTGSVGRPLSKPIVVDADSLPPGVGRSPIEHIEIEDLHSIEAIRSALKCKVCGREAKRLGVVADCLRAHGVQRCSLCFNSYCSKADYTLHLKKCHGSSGNKLKCPLCPKAFSNAGQTSGHMYSTHWLQILRENEQASKNEAADKAGKKGEGGTDKEADFMEPDADDADKNGDDSGKEEGVNGNNSASEEGINDDDKSGGDPDVDDRDPLEEEEEDDTMQVEGSSELEINEDEAVVDE